jgi:iron complex outermembrane receptor protein
VTATRVEENSFDLPISIDVVESKSIHDGQLAMSVAESLGRVPGITANDRSEMTQDTQISTRGFGARSAFGVRGIRLYLDGISLSSSDGISFPGSINLDNIKSIEVMRGPFSSLYGSSSGGVVQFLTADAPKNNEITSSFMAGSYGTTKESLNLAGTEGQIEYILSSTTFNTDGYRQHSAAHEEESNAHLKINLANDTRVVILANYMNLEAQDPLGSRSTSINSGSYKEYSVFTDPTASPTVALVDNTRVHKENTQVGVTVAHDIDQNNTINLINYVGHRINSQILALSTNSNSAKDSAYTRDFFGNEINWVNNGKILDHNYSITSGLVYGSTRDNREDITITSGIINRNEIDNASNLDEYLQGKLSILDSIDLHMGARNTNINYDVKSIKNPTTQTGGLHFSDTTSVLGATWKALPALNFYANYGRGFETPTLTEIAYTNGISSGPNLNLKASTSNNYEIGTKAFIGNSTKVNLAIFNTDTNNEIVITQGGSYTIYGNSATTSRKGLEFSIDSILKNNFNIYGAYTYLDAQFDSTYSNGTTNVNAGNRIPGVYRNQIYGELSWNYPSLNFTSAFEGRYMSKTFADDVNQNFAPSYTVFNLRTGFKQTISNWKLSEYFRIDNLLGENYIGAVRINDSNGRFFEAAPGRNYLVGLSASYGF